MLEEQKITFESISCINVSENDVLVLKTDTLLRKDAYIDMENEISKKIGCKVVIIEPRFNPITILKK